MSIENLLSAGVEGVGLYVLHARDVLREDPGNYEVAANLRITTHGLSQVQAELRKTESAAKKDAAFRTQDEVLAYARTLPPDERSKLVRKLQALDGPRNVLG